MVTRDTLLLSFAEGKGFWELMASAEPECKPACGRTRAMREGKMCEDRTEDRLVCTTLLQTTPQLFVTTTAIAFVSTGRVGEGACRCVFHCPLFVNINVKI